MVAIKLSKEIQIDLILKHRDNSTKVYKANIDKSGYLDSL
jgi:hypothetical protein